MSTESSTEHSPELDGTWRVSLAFWICLLFSAVLYAAVALSPKLLNYVTLRTQYLQNQTELVSLEQRVTHLARVKLALQNDPQFAAELARIDFDATRPGDERIAVEPLLSLESVPRSHRTHSTETSSRVAWFSSSLELLAANRNVRASILILAAIVTLGAFTFLGEAKVSEVEEVEEIDAPPPGLLRRFLHRYRKRDAEVR